MNQWGLGLDRLDTRGPRVRGEPVPGVVHGIRRSYQHGGCRCALCFEANAAYQRHFYRARVGHPSIGVHDAATTAARRAQRRSDTHKRREARERDREQIEYLRGLVALNWRRDRFYSGHEVSLDAMVARGPIDHLLSQQDTRPWGLAIDAAALVLRAADEWPLLDRALNEPASLTDWDRAVLRATFDAARELVA